MYRIFAAALVAVLTATSPATAEAAAPVERKTIPDPKGQPLEVGIWVPSNSALPNPLILMSHGTGGDFQSHRDTAEALAESGFVVAAVTHTGDNWRDLSGSVRIWERPRHLKVLTDYMLNQWVGRVRIDPARIGAFGFSAGGFTVLVAAGGKPDLRRIRGHCRAHPDIFECRLLAAAPALRDAPKVEWTGDRRIKAIVVAAPALGYTFSADGLKQVMVPVQLWRASHDEILPHPFYAEAVKSNLPGRADYRVATNAGHFDFLAPCTPEAARLRPEICASRSGFNRVAFHSELNQAAISFFQESFAGPRNRK